MDERLRILKMVEDSTITAEQAAELMKAMGVEAEQTTAVAHRSYDKKMFRIIVDSTGGDKVNIQFPYPPLWRQFPSAWMKRLKVIL